MKDENLLVNGIQITERTTEEVISSVGNDNRKQEREGERNDKYYSQIEEKSDYDIYNPAVITAISLSIGEITNLKVGQCYPITVTPTPSIANIPTIIYHSSDLSKAYVKDGILYACGTTAKMGDEGYDGNADETVEIDGYALVKNENGVEGTIKYTLTGLKIS